MACTGSSPPKSKDWVILYLLFYSLTVVDPYRLSSGRSGGQARASRAHAGDDVAAASLASILRYDAEVGSPAIGEVGAELLGLLETALDAGGTHGAQAVVGVARVRLGALLALGHLNEVAAALDGVDEGEARGEDEAAPAAVHVGDATAVLHVVLGVDVEVGNLADGVAGGVGGDGGDVVDAEAGHVVGLPDEAVLDVLVVVDGGDGSWKIMVSMGLWLDWNKSSTHPCRDQSAWGSRGHECPRCRSRGTCPWQDHCHGSRQSRRP